MASSSHKKQNGLKMCKQHQEKELTIFCNSCKKEICSLCFRKHHQTHDWELISELANQMRNDLPDICQKIKNEDISEIRKQLELFETLISSTESDSRQAEESLNQARKFLIGEINKLADDKIRESQKRTASLTLEYRAKVEDLKKKMKDVETISNDLGTANDKFTDHEIIEMKEKIMTGLDEAKSFDAEKHTNRTVFVAGEINLQSVGEMIGEIAQISLDRTSKFQPSSSSIMDIVPTSESNAWILNKESLLNSTGEEIRTLNMSVNFLAVTEDGRTVIIQTGDRVLDILDDNDEIVENLEIPNLEDGDVSCVSATSDGGLLIALMSVENLYDVQPNDRRMVQRMTLTGQVLQTYEFEEDGYTRLFTFPGRISENKNGDICVINFRSESETELVVLYTDGRVRVTYGGRKTHCCFIDVACDSQCRIILADELNKTLQVLNPEGKLICVLRTFDSTPYCVDLNQKGDNLWIGFENGEVQTYTYK